MAIIKFVSEKKEIQVPEGSNLRREAHGPAWASTLASTRCSTATVLGTCGSCRVLITKGMDNTSPMGVLEKTRLGMSMAYVGNENTMRLSCQTQVNGDIEVQTTPSLNWFGENFFS